MSIANLNLLAAIFLRTAIVLIVLFGGLRVLGKRAIAELNIRDLLLILMVSNAVQNSMTKGAGALSVAFVAGATLLVIGWLIATVIVRLPSLERRAMGHAAVLVYHGRLNGRIVRRERLDSAEIMTAVREQGLARLDQVRLAVLEIDGTISIVPEETAPKA